MKQIIAPFIFTGKVIGNVNFSDNEIFMIREEYITFYTLYKTNKL